MDDTEMGKLKMTKQPSVRNNRPKISIIVPVYNVEKYLSQCLDSITKQDYKNLEVILIDDSSTDNSYQICKEYAKKDLRFKVYQQKHLGPGPARNLGLSYATGEWLSFVDSDDVLMDNYYTSLMSHINDGLNIICANVKILFDIENNEKQIDENFYSNDFCGSICVNDELKKQINTELWNKIFRKSIFDKYNITFKEGAFEDGDILFKVLAVSEKIYYDISATYFYRRREDSIVEKLSRGILAKNYNMVHGAVEELYRLYDFFTKNDLLEKNIKFLLFLLQRNYYWVYSHVSVTLQLEIEQKMSDFLHDCISDEMINLYGDDVALLYRLKVINADKPFYEKDAENKNIKIAVCYHKPSLLPNKDSKVFFPIHVGRAIATETSKDGNIDQKNYQWMLDNMIGDDTDDNISYLNRKFCELTAIYWAWKNYNKIGNPEYFGLCHYRRIFNLYNVDIDADAYIVPAWKSPETAYQQYLSFHKTRELDIALEIIKEDYPEYESIATEYYNTHNLHLLNMFIMKKDIFLKYASWLFEILNKVEQKIDYSYKSYQQLRTLAYLAERLQDIYTLKLSRDGYVVKELPVLYPNEEELALEPKINVAENIKVIVTSCDDNYVLYAGVMIKSVIENVPEDEKINFYILDGGISEEHKNSIKKLSNEQVNIFFINMSYYIQKFGNLFKTDTHFTPATYYRFFVPLIFSNCEKVLYLDPDMIIRYNILSLFDINLEDKLIGACRDVEAERKFFSDSELTPYFNDILCIKDMRNYFQAGVLVFNIQKMNEFSFTEKCLTKLKKIGRPMWVDQDVMNSVCYGQIKYFDPQWNYCFFLELDNKHLMNNLHHSVYDMMMQVRKNPRVIHYCGGPKPWVNSSLPMADIFWHYARMTPFYEEIIYKNLSQNNAVQTVVQSNSEVSPQLIKDLAKKNKISFKYWKYKILSKMTFGKKRKRCKQKKKDLKIRVKAVKNFLKGK